ncbi:MAG: carboxypeptidase-like regulatory domain-containing protein [Saprospiraceae bacterium]|nr:carboxypeptidase-like regulatory domain-containing protein [Saprospiraceae bacterium]
MKFIQSLSVIIFVLFLSPIVIFSQNNLQNIRGAVLDKLSQTALIGASVALLNHSENKGTITDENGQYTLSDLAPGRYEVRVSYVGYKDVIVPNVVVTSGKEVILDLAMEEDLKLLDEVVIKAYSKNKTINDLATISARTFSMEEVNRYAGGRGDPARLAANFAGVSAPDDSRNDIVIRGNSPVGVLWRIDGMNVTNPNHFATVGTTGGAVSALNTNLLKSSDFFTSAFPSEYGNAISGVFDLGFRSGNTQKRETTVQAGVITGLEVTTEGPISKKNNSSYVAGYRYALAGVAQAVGVDIGTTATPSYQDLSFKVNSGNTRWGKFTTFGILATSDINISGDNAGSLFGGKDGNDLASKIGIVGVNHFKQLTEKSYLSSIFGVNYSKTDQINYATDRATETSYEQEESNVAKTGYNIGTTYNTKINTKAFLKVGLQNEFMGLDLYYRTKRNINDEWTQIWDYDSYTSLSQGFAHLKYSFNDRLTLHAGLHAQYFFLNGSKAVEPRLGLKYDLNTKSSLNFGYGLHAQMQPINVYFLQTQNADGTTSYNNEGLDFTKSHHFVVGYDVNPFKDWRIKAELYYQYLYDVPVNTFSSSYSMLNTGASFKTELEDLLTNAGTGQNYGVELTIEKFFSNGYYGLFTSSLYSSKYTGSEGVERNTAFNGQYVYNFLAGKEWNIGKTKRNRFSIDFKLTNAGGRAYTPIDLEASQATGREVLNSEAYSGFYDDYLRMDVKLNFTFNSKKRKLSQTLSLDVQNVTNNDNVFSQKYDNQTENIRTTYQLGLFPNVVYKVQF